VVTHFDAAAIADDHGQVKAYGTSLHPPLTEITNGQRSDRQRLAKKQQVRYDDPPANRLHLPGYLARIRKIRVMRLRTDRRLTSVAELLETGLPTVGDLYASFELFTGSDSFPCSTPSGPAAAKRF
jgi:hypothetical protein